MAIGKDFKFLETKIKYKFSEESYLENALTHSSYSNEYKAKGLLIPSNERLEFLGDAILEMVISEYLYNNFRDVSEGKLTRMRQQLVCEKTLVKIAESIELGNYIHLGRGEEYDCRTRPKVLADTLEALFAAIYMDSRALGNEKYKDIIINLYSSEFETSTVSGVSDYKTLLQQFIEKDGSAVLEYAVVEEKGPEHNKHFTVVAKVNNNVAGTGSARNKKGAEMQAAKNALKLFGFKL